MSRPHIKRTTAPESSPIGVEEAAEHCRIDSNDDLPYLQSLIDVCTEYVEAQTGRTAITSTYTLVAPSWHSLVHGDDERHEVPYRNIWSIPLPRAPLASVTSVKYYASGSESQTTAASSLYRVITSRDPGILQFIDTPPSVEDRLDAIEIVFKAGTADPCDSPPVLRHAIKLMVAHLYEQRANVNIGSVAKEIPYTLKTMIEHEKISGWLA